MKTILSIFSLLGGGYYATLHGGILIDLGHDMDFIVLEPPCVIYPSFTATCRS